MWTGQVQDAGGQSSRVGPTREASAQLLCFGVGVAAPVVLALAVLPLLRLLRRCCCSDKHARSKEATPIGATLQLSACRSPSLILGSHRHGPIVAGKAPAIPERSGHPSHEENAKAGLDTALFGVG